MPLEVEPTRGEDKNEETIGPTNIVLPQQTGLILSDRFKQ